MRQIKFRAWDLEKGIWITPGFHLNSFGVVMINVRHDTEYGVGFHEEPYPRDCELEQFTGEHDEDLYKKNEIYEGDIVDAHYGKGVVIFQAGCFMIEWIDDKEAMLELLTMDSKNKPRPVKLLGNIHENPELLK